MEKGCLVRSKPKVLVVELPLLRVIPIEARRLRLQVWTAGATGLHTIFHYFDYFFPNSCVYFCILYHRIHCGHRYTPHRCGGMQWVWGWCLRQTCSLPCTSPTGCSRESVCTSILTKDSTQPHWGGWLSHILFQHVKCWIFTLKFFFLKLKKRNIGKLISYD